MFVKFDRVYFQNQKKLNYFPLSKVEFQLTHSQAPLGGSDRRAQKKRTQKLSLSEYNKLIEPIDINSAQFMMLHNPRDARLTAVKIAHDYNIKFTLPKVVKVYYDIETACFNSADVPQHTDRNAFITCIAAVTVLQDGSVKKEVFLNNHLRYTTDTIDADIELQ